MIKLWIARDEGYDEEFMHDRYTHITGELHLFYDRPELVRDSTDDRIKWTNARVIGNPESYMFPDIKEKECVELTGKTFEELCDEIQSLMVDNFNNDQVKQYNKLKEPGAKDDEDVDELLERYPEAKLEI